jgi:CheY-like chemotaxis protein
MRMPEDLRPSLPEFNCRVLIIDDVADNRERYALYFAGLGWEVRLASNGAEGIGDGPRRAS